MQDMAIPAAMEPLIQWGKLVEVAYEMYKQKSLAPSMPADFPSGWERIANLTMKPRLETLKEKEFAGYIIRSAANPLLQTVVIRGTESGLDWLSDFEFILERFHEVPGSGKPSRGLRISTEA
jgi:triacylglycerol lipase